MAPMMSYLAVGSTAAGVGRGRAPARTPGAGEPEAERPGTGCSPAGAACQGTGAGWGIGVAAGGHAGWEADCGGSWLPGGPPPPDSPAHSVRSIH
eukprot:scaffold7041_cov41-Prasinocladus_malaysianus.AAC.1